MSGHACADPRACWLDFWKRLVGLPDREVSDELKAELFDFHMVMGEVAAAYDDVTGGLISKPTTMAHYVIEAVEDRLHERYEEGYKDGEEAGSAAMSNPPTQAHVHEVWDRWPHLHYPEGLHRHYPYAETLAGLHDQPEAQGQQ